MADFYWAFIFKMKIYLYSLLLSPFLHADEITVTNNLNMGTGSLRDAIANVDGGGTIVFASDMDGKVIQIDTELIVNKSLDIDASILPNGIIIDGGSNADFILDDGETRCFFISDGDEDTMSSVVLINLTIQNGVVEAEEAGANIHNREMLTLNGCEIKKGRGRFQNSSE